MATKALVNNKTFQRFALKTVQNSQKVAKAVGEKTSQVKNSSVRCLAFSLSQERDAVPQTADVAHERLDGVLVALAREARRRRLARRAAVLGRLLLIFHVARHLMGVDLRRRGRQIRR